MASKSSPFRVYLRESRELGTSLVLVLPLFVTYQLGVLLTGGLRNGVDFVTSALFAVFGGNVLVYLGFNAVMLVAFLVGLRALRSRGGFEPRHAPWVLLESAVYALFFGSFVIFAIRSVGLGKLLFIPGSLSVGPALAQGATTALSPIAKVVMSAGAGLYEELVFRLGLMGGAFWLLTRAGVARFVAAALAVVGSSVIFSAIHHVGALGEAFTMSAFTFRVFAGMGFALIYQTRGFAVAAYTHAIYDIYVMFLREG